MKLTRQHRREARLLWQSVAVDGIPDAERIRAAIDSLQQQIGRDAEPVLRCFLQRLAVYIRSNRIRFVSATPLSVVQQEQLAGMAATPDGTQTSVQFDVDASVLGGLRLEQGYQVTDRTIARQLDVLQGILLKN